MTVPRFSQMRLSDAVGGFIIYRRADGYSDGIVNINQWALARLIDYLGNPELSKIDNGNLREFLSFMRTEYQPNRPGGNTAPLSPASIDSVWASVRAFYRWAEMELGAPRPDLKLRRPVYKNPVVQPFTREEIDRLMAAAEFTVEANTKTRKPFRMRRPTASRDMAIILFLLDTGLRVSECARVLLEHVNLEVGEVTVLPHGSSRKSSPRHVFMGNVSRRAVWKYINEREFRYPEDPLFLTMDNRPMNRGSILHVIANIGKRAGIKRVHPHRFRHTFAIQYLRNGGDIFTLQKLLGHSSLDMVQKYLALVKDDAQNAHRSASPVDRWRL